MTTGRHLLAQTAGTSVVKVQVEVVELGYEGKKKRDPVYKFSLDSLQGKPLNKGGNCYIFSHKDDVRRFTPGTGDAATADKYLETFEVDAAAQNTVVISMESFDKDKGEPCIFNERKDDQHMVASHTFNLKQITPGDFSDTVRVKDPAGIFYAIVKLRYTLPPAGSPKTNLTLNINNAENDVTLRSSFPLETKQGLQFTWQYLQEPSNEWVTLPVTATDMFNVHINPLADMFQGKLTETKKVQLRLKAQSRDTCSYSPVYSTVFTPRPPSVHRDNIKLVKTCKALSDGSLTVRNIESVTGKTAYVLLSKDGSVNGCALDAPVAANCPGLVKAGQVTGSSFDIKKLDAGDYTLVLYNGGVEVGTNYTIYPCKVGMYADFQVAAFNLRNPTCSDPRPGELQMVFSGGNLETPLTKVLEPMAGTSEENGNEINFKSLPGNSYKLSVTDGCGTELRREFSVLADAPKLVIENIMQLKSGAGGATDFRFVMKNGKGPFQITIKNDDGYIKQEELPSANFTLQLRKGKSQINITDKSDPDCLRADTILTVQPKAGEALHIPRAGTKEKTLLKQPVSCMPAAYIIEATMHNLPGTNRSGHFIAGCAMAASEGGLLKAARFYPTSKSYS